MQTRILATEQWDALAPNWGTWHAGDPDAALYETPEYVRYRLRELPPNYVGGIVEFSKAGEPFAFVPFRFQRSLAGIPTRDAQTLGLGAHAPGHAPPEAALLSQALRPLRPYRCRVETREGNMEPQGGFRGYERLAGKDGLIPLAETWDGFVEKQSSRMRKHLRHALRVMEKEGWELIDLSAEAEEAIEHANVLHDEYLNHKFPVYRGAYRTAQRDASFATCFGEATRVYALARGEAVASILYGARHRDRFYLFRQGNDPAYLDAFADGASLTLRAAMIRELTQEGVEAVDVVGGTEGLWAAQPGGRRLAVFRSRAPHALACRAAAEALVRNHRTGWVSAARSLAGRLSPRLAAHAA